MWKIFFIYKDKSGCTVQGKGTITPELAVKCYYWYGLHAAESIYQQYPKPDQENIQKWLNRYLRMLATGTLRTAGMPAATTADMPVMATA